jgi:hypothetical protein
MSKYLTPLGYKIPKKAYEAMAEMRPRLTHEEILRIWDILQTDEPYRELCYAVLKYTIERDKK